MESSEEEKTERSRLQEEKPEAFEALVVEPRGSTPPPFTRSVKPPKGPSRKRVAGSSRYTPVASPNKGRDCSSSDDEAFANTPWKSKPSTPKGRTKITRSKPSPKSPPKKKVKKSRGPQTLKTSRKETAVATTPIESRPPTAPKRKRGYTIRRRRPTCSPLSNPQQETTSGNSSLRRVETIQEQLSDHEVDFPENNFSSGDNAFAITPPGRNSIPTIPSFSNPLLVDTTEEQGSDNEHELSTTVLPPRSPSDPSKRLPNKETFEPLRETPPVEIPEQSAYLPTNEPHPSTSRTCRRRQSNENEENKNVEVNINAINQPRLSTTEHPEGKTSKKKFPVLRQRPQNENSTSRLPQRPCVESSDYESSDNEERKRRRRRQRRRRRKHPGQIIIGSSSSSNKSSSSDDSDDEYRPIVPSIASPALHVDIAHENESNEEVDFVGELSEIDEERPSPRIVIPSTKGFQVDWENIPLKYKVLLRLGEQQTRLSEDRDEELKIIKERFENYGIDINPERVFWKKIRTYKGRPERERYVLGTGTKKQPLKHITFETYVYDQLAQQQSGAKAARYQLLVETPVQREKRRSDQRKRYKENEKARLTLFIYQQEHRKFIVYQLILFNQENLMELSAEELLQQIRVDPSLQVQTYSGKWICRTPTSSYRTTHSASHVSLCRALAQSGYRCLQLHLQMFSTLKEAEEFEAYIIFNENAYRDFNRVYGIVNIVPGIRIHSDVVKKAIQLGRIGIKLCRNNEDEDMADDDTEDLYDLHLRIDADNFRDVTEKIKGRPTKNKNSRPEPEPEEFLVYIAVGFKSSDVTYNTKAELEEILKMKPDTPFHVYAGLWSRLPGEKNHGIRSGHFRDPTSKLYTFVNDGGQLYAAQQFVCSTLEEAKKLEAFLIMQMFTFADYNSFCHPLNTQYGSIIISSDEILEAISQGSTAERLFVLSNNNSSDPKSLPWSVELDDITSRFHNV